MTVLSITALFVCLVLCCSGSSSIGSNNKSFVLAQPAAEEAETVVAADASSASTSSNDAPAQASPFQDLISSDASVSETEVAALKELGAGLLAWLNANGVDVSTISMVATGSGFIAQAREDIPKGHVYDIPSTLLFSTSNVEKSNPELTGWLEEFSRSNKIELRSSHKLVIQLMHETFHNPSSPWRPYLVSLPARPLHAHFLSDAAMQVLTILPAVRTEVDNHHNQLRDNFQFLRQHFFAAHPEVYGDLKAEGVAEALFAQFVWAGAIVSTRGFHTGELSSEAAETVLVPLLDNMLFAASEEPSVTWTTGSFPSFTHTLPSAVPRGDYVPIATPFYPTCNWELLLTRGILVNETKFNCLLMFQRLVPLRAPQQEAQRLGNGTIAYAVDSTRRGALWSAYARMGFVTDANTDSGTADVPFMLREGSQLPEDMLPLMRIGTLTTAEFGLLGRAANREVVSLMNELQAVRTLVGAFTAIRKKIGQTYQALVDSGDLDADERTWDAEVRMVMSVVVGALKALDSGISAAHETWNEFVSNDYTEVSIPSHDALDYAAQILKK